MQVLLVFETEKTTLVDVEHDHIQGDLSREAALETVLRSVKCEAVYKKREADNAQRIDEWDIDLLDRESSEVWER
jgi:hypothetical protein